ncbi:protein containing Pirin [mine drainage metagenome]|uniref:Protein containing Pirin n=1 Tax=mine drainage metagenome TaxID=410659 RepID=T0ZVU6_9ZZZZ
MFVLHGQLQIDAQAIQAAEMAVMERAGTRLQAAIVEDSIVLLLSGQPLDESIVGHGPFVMNTQAEIVQAMEDFNNGKFGRIPH